MISERTLQRAANSIRVQENKLMWLVSYTNRYVLWGGKLSASEPEIIVCYDKKRKKCNEATNDAFQRITTDPHGIAMLHTHGFLSRGGIN